MSAFDDAFADRVREVFDAYHEPVDPAALARMRAALGHAAPVAPDRASVASQRTMRRGVSVALAALMVAGGVWLQTRSAGSSPETIANAETVQPADASGTATPPSAPTPPASVTPSEGSADSPALAPSTPARTAPSPSRQPSGALASRDLRSQGASRPTPTTARPEVEAPEAGAFDLGAPSPVEVSATDSRLIDHAQRAPEAVEIAPLPAIAGVPATSGRPRLPALVRPSPGVAPSDTRSPVAAASPYRVTLSTSAPLSAGSGIAGVGVAGGVAREWPVAGRVSVSGGAVLAYNRYDVGRATGLSLPTLEDLNDDPSRSLSVPSRTQAETVALEVPLDLAFDIAGTRRTRLGVSVGVTSAVYLSQTFRDEGTRFSGDFQSGTTGDPVFEVASESYTAQSSEGALSRVELLRQLNLGVSLARRRGLALEAYTRLPLGGLTDRDLGLTTVGVRLRVPIR